MNYILAWLLACKKGYYKEGLVPGVCKRCPENTTTDHQAATSLADCKLLPGKSTEFIRII